MRHAHMIHVPTIHCPLKPVLGKVAAFLCFLQQLVSSFHGCQQAPVLQMEDVIQQNTPEELAPLIEALERARQQQEEATGIREALEAEVRSEQCIHTE